MPMQAVFKVAPSEAQKFSQVWNYKGIAVPLQEPHIQFATDFANVVLNNFIMQCQMKAAQAAAQVAAQEVVSARQLIVEGVPNADGAGVQGS